MLPLSPITLFLVFTKDNFLFRYLQVSEGFLSSFKQFLISWASKRIDCVLRANYESEPGKCFPIFLHVINPDYRMVQLYW